MLAIKFDKKFDKKEASCSTEPQPCMHQARPRKRFRSNAWAIGQSHKQGGFNKRVGIETIKFLNSAIKKRARWIRYNDA